MRKRAAERQSPDPLRLSSVRACSAGSRFRSLRSPLRDLDPASARPSEAHIGAGRTAEAECSRVITVAWDKHSEGQEK
jgi:hypothetical protein